MDTGDGDSAAQTPKRPWWTWVIPYPGRVPQLSKKQWRVLGLLAVAELFDQYDMGLMSLALTQIQAGLGIGEADIGRVTAVARAGVLISMILVVMADRFGRRRLLLVTILGFTVTTFATAFARDARDFMILQFFARAFIYTELILAPVVLAEELKAKDRGWGIGMLGALGSLGQGVAALAFAFVDDLPFGWRALYAFGATPMLFLAWFRRSLTETRRFEEHRASREGAGGLRELLRPVVSLARMYPGRLLVLTFALFPFGFLTTTAFTFLPKTLQEVHGYSPGEVTLLFIVGGSLGILGNIAAGALADRFGRRPVLLTAVAINGVAIVGFYNSVGYWIPLLWIATVFTILATEVLFKALGAELFPTSYRSTASGVRMLVDTLGGITGLALEGMFYTSTGSHAAAITAMAPVLIISLLAIAFFLPETATRELEDIAPEKG